VQLAPHRKAHRPIALVQSPPVQPAGFFRYDALPVIISAIRTVATYVAVSLYVLLVAPPGMLLAIVFRWKGLLYVLGHLGVRLALFTTGISFRLTGRERLPLDRAAVYCSNHQSLLDVLVLGGALPGDFKWAAKRELFKIPFLGWHLALAGHVPVERKAGARAAAEVIGKFEEVLAAGKPLLVFPEGTRSESGILQPFKNGGFYASVRKNAPVVPVALEGTHHLMHKGALDAGDGTTLREVRVRIGKPLFPKTEGREGVRVAELRDRTYAAVAELHASIGGTLPDKPAA